MDLRPKSVRELLAQLQRLPGVGPRSARLLVEHLLTVDEDEVAALVSALGSLRQQVSLCSICSLLTEYDPCPVCSDSSRDRGVILVVEEPTAAWAVEGTGEYHGLYHALLGHLSPLHGVGPEDLTISALLQRVETGEVREVIIATDPTVEGETTALYLTRRLQSLSHPSPGALEISRPASGIPVGGELVAVDQVTLAQALQLRRKL